MNRLLQLDFWMKLKNFEVQNPHWQMSMKDTIPGTPCIIKTTTSNNNNDKIDNENN